MVFLHWRKTTIQRIAVLGGTHFEERVGQYEQALVVLYSSRNLDEGGTPLKYFFCIVLPPVAVLMANRKAAFVLNLVLTLCFWIPGVIHAFIVVNSAEA